MIVITVIQVHEFMEKSTTLTQLSHNRKTIGATYELPIVTEKWSGFDKQTNLHKKVKPIHPRTYRLHEINNLNFGGFTIYEHKK